MSTAQALPPAVGAAAAGAGWVWGARRDLAVFGGAAALGIGFGLALRADGSQPLPEGLWLVFVLGLDVAHVWTTLFRTYLDRAELARRRGLYLGVPLACYATGVALHLASGPLFWRVLAYAAAFHFVRQQVGWVAIARARAGGGGWLDRRLDEATIYLATGVPLLHWHAHPPRAFRWFVDGDFALGGTVSEVARVLVGPAVLVYALVGAIYLARAVLATRAGRPAWGKHLVVGTTALGWWVGIVTFDDDVVFTLTNVTLHGVPYVALLWFYAKARAAERPRTLLATVVAGGFAAFFAVALGFAFVEELLWDRLIWHDREWLFGDGMAPSSGLRAWLVPLLALPQATHYALDGVLWRRKDGGSAQAAALGFSSS